MEKIKKGKIEVICGSMFSGKTEELIRRLRRGVIAKQKVVIFKPSVDNRYDEQKVVSHDQNSVSSIPVKSSNEILQKVLDADIVGLDEAQFFDIEIVEVSKKLACMGKRVIVAGLDMDFLGNPFGPMPYLLAIADSIKKVHAICVSCGDLALFSNRIHPTQDIILLGEKNTYEPLCRTCYHKAVNKTMKD